MPLKRLQHEKCLAVCNRTFSCHFLQSVLIIIFEELLRGYSFLHVWRREGIKKEVGTRAGTKQADTKKPVALTNATSFILYGAGTKSRTRDPLITSQLLYQLSYTGKERCVYYVRSLFLSTRFMDL